MIVIKLTAYLAVYSTTQFAHGIPLEDRREMFQCTTTSYTINYVSLTKLLCSKCVRRGEGFELRNAFRK